jgi:hypothetical protein
MPGEQFSWTIFQEAQMTSYTVYLPGGTKDYEFEAYVRLLNKRGVDIANIPRVHDPATGNGWLFVWADREPAEEFATELRASTNNNHWEVVELKDVAPSQGPLMPIEIVVGRRSDGCTYSLNPLSRALIRRRYPDSKMVPSVFVATDTKYDFETTQGPILPQIATILTGLPDDALTLIGGFRVYDPASKQVLKEALA